jgi:DNA-binding CsgD family transcriptional regulator
VRKRSPEKRKVLTAQEERIGRLARDGLSTPEISGQIFITARTVEWHLRKEFTKLGIRDSLASVQTLVRGPGAYWSGSEVPGHSRRQGLDAFLRARHLARCRLGRASCDSSSFRCRGWRRTWSRVPMEGRVGVPLALV